MEAKFRAETVGTPFPASTRLIVLVLTPDCSDNSLTDHRSAKRAALICAAINIDSNSK